MNAGLTASEQLVNEPSTSSFMTLWTHPNPVGKGGKELCDCLVVCGPYIVIISVEGIWDALIRDPDYLARNKDRESSYAWDRLIERFVEDFLKDGMFDMFRSDFPCSRYRASLRALAIDWVAAGCPDQTRRI
ncbi:hypothetical protein [Paracidovorax avenae]|uniref:hypothetical protein n=1 Tax=Paracidovorax avenae TaxID=80867 RepID=UPI000D1FFBA3|nr:hypothetical protein [Paracidovorax avenae]AVS83761.1 hypothetical protein C8239_02455 [Paracidovorax avenae]AVT01359.1 hypothetical protein C8243_01820 [Paracidovorax avenae]AVT08432.1 hypothetical protein C8242_02180 [Paracidovorax avenae]